MSFSSKIAQYIPFINIAYMGASVWIAFEYGLLALLGIIGLWVATLLWISWDNYMMYIRLIEGQIWGRPLDAEYWKKGEKIPRVKFVWRKKNAGQHKKNTAFK